MSKFALVFNSDYTDDVYICDYDFTTQGIFLRTPEVLNGIEGLDSLANNEILFIEYDKDYFGDPTKNVVLRSKSIEVDNEKGGTAAEYIREQAALCQQHAFAEDLYALIAQQAELVCCKH